MSGVNTRLRRLRTLSPPLLLRYLSTSGEPGRFRHATRVAPAQGQPPEPALSLSKGEPATPALHLPAPGATLVLSPAPAAAEGLVPGKRTFTSPRGGPPAQRNNQTAAPPRYLRGPQTGPLKKLNQTPDTIPPNQSTALDLPPASAIR